MTLVRWSPWRDIMSVQDEMNRLFNGLATRRGVDSGAEDWVPSVDISETDVPGLVHVAVTVSWAEPRGEDELSVATLARGGQAVEDKLQEREAQSEGGMMQ